MPGSHVAGSMSSCLSGCLRATLISRRASDSAPAVARSTASTSLLDVVEVLEPRELHVRRDHHQQIVEIVRDVGDEIAERAHAPQLPARCLGRQPRSPLRPASAPTRPLGVRAAGSKTRPAARRRRTARARSPRPAGSCATSPRRSTPSRSRSPHRADSRRRGERRAACPRCRPSNVIRTWPYSSLLRNALVNGVCPRAARRRARGG